MAGGKAIHYFSAQKPESQSKRCNFGQTETGGNLCFSEGQWMTVAAGEGTGAGAPTKWRTSELPSSDSGSASRSFWSPDSATAAPSDAALGA